MGTYDLARQRILAYGNSESDALVKSSQDKISKGISNAPNYVTANIDGASIGARVVNTDESNIKTLLFAPHTMINYGANVDISDGYKYLVMDFRNKFLAPNATIKRCNTSLNWKDQNGTLHSYNCILDDKLSRLELKGTTSLIVEPNGITDIIVQYNSTTSSILLEQRFIINGLAYIVEGIDNASRVYNGHGYIQLSMKNDITLVTDDLVNNLADNTKLYQANLNTQAPVKDVSISSYSGKVF